MSARDRFVAMRRSSRVALLTGLLGVSGTSGQEDEDIRRHGIFSDSLEVHVVNVAVVVTDRAGNPVTGLGPDDFEVLEDGDRMEISNFFAVHGDRTAPAPGPTAVADGTVAERAPPGPDTRLFLALVVDLHNSLPVNRNLILQDLETLLPRALGPDDRVLIATYDGRLRVEQAFTADPAEIGAVLERIQRIAGQGSFLGIERGRIMAAMTDATDPLANQARAMAGFGATDEDILTDAQESLSEITLHAESLQKQVRQTTEALGRFSDSLAGLPGRKAVLYLSDGLPLRPAEELFYAWEGKYPQVAEAEFASATLEAEQYSTEQAFLDLVARANANQVPLYTLFGGGNQRGLGVHSRDRDLQTDRHGVNLAAVIGPAMENSMRRLASETGGQAQIDPRGAGRLLDGLMTDTSTYYSLGYVPPTPEDGRYHRLKVKMKGRGLRLRYPAGYHARTQDERMAARTTASLLLDVGDNPLGIRLVLGEQRVEGKDVYRVPVRVQVPVANLVMLPEGDRHRGRLSFYVVSQDRDGNLSQVQKIPLQITIPNEQVQAAVASDAAKDLLLQMRVGEQKLAIGVRDEIAATVSTVNLQVVVGSPPS